MTATPTKTLEEVADDSLRAGDDDGEGVELLCGVDGLALLCGVDGLALLCGVDGLALLCDNDRLALLCARGGETGTGAFARLRAR